MKSFWASFFVLFILGGTPSLFKAQKYRFAVQKVAISSENDAAGKHVFKFSEEDAVIDIEQKKLLFIEKEGGEILDEFSLVQFSQYKNTEESVTWNGLTADRVEFRLEIQKGHTKLDDLIFFQDGKELVHMQGYTKTFP